MKLEHTTNCTTMYCNSKEVAQHEGVPIKMIARYAKNGRKYVWLNPSQQKLDELIHKYGVDQLANGVMWNGDKREVVECLWLEQ